MNETPEEAWRRSEARRTGEDLDIAFFEENKNRGHRIRLAQWFEFGQERDQYAIVRMRDDFTTEAAPLEIERPLPDIEGLAKYLWQAIDFASRFNGGAPITLPITDAMIVDFMKGARRG